jgi:ABC-type sugar transport system ATPase subunit
MLSLKKLNVAVSNFALHDINLDIGSGEYFILVGPTGAGKTLLVETIAGINPVKSGEIWLDGRNITRSEPEKRGITIVYQNSGLFPHLSVKQNIAFGLRVRKQPKASIARAVEEIAESLKITQLLSHQPGTLSGGESKKVALARSLIVKPRLLLLDEPLSALDPETRENIREELRKIHLQLGVNIIHITHDFEEAISLGQSIGVMGDGEIKQLGTPEQIFHHPNSEFVARFTMMRNIYPGELTTISGVKTFRTTGTNFKVNTNHPEGKCYAGIRPEDVMISHDNNLVSGNILSGNIHRIIDYGAIYHISIDVPPEIICTITRHTFEEMHLFMGQKIYLGFTPASVQIF